MLPQRFRLLEARAGRESETSSRGGSRCASTVVRRFIAESRGLPPSSPTVWFVTDHRSGRASRLARTFGRIYGGKI